MKPALQWVLLCGLLWTGCRKTGKFKLEGSEFRLVTRGGNSILLPPPVVHQYDQKALSFTIPIPGLKAETAARKECQVESELFGLKLVAGPRGLAVVRLPAVAQWEAMLKRSNQGEQGVAEERAVEMLTAPELFEQRQCLGAGSAVAVKQLLRETIPLRPVQSLFAAYGHRAGGESLDLRGGLRLKMVRAHFDKPLEQRKSVSDGYSGLSSTFYECFEDGRGRIAFRYTGVDYEPESLKRKLARPVEDLKFGKEAHAMPVYRLLMLTHYLRSGLKRSAVVLGTASMGQMRTLETKLREAPGLSCSELAAGAKIVCIPFEGEVTISPELRVIVNGAPQYVSWGTKVRNLLSQFKAGDDASKSVQLRRTWEKELRRVEVDGDKDAILGAVLVGGDEVVWGRN